MRRRGGGRSARAAPRDTSGYYSTDNPPSEIAESLIANPWASRFLAAEPSRLLADSGALNRAGLGPGADSFRGEPDSGSAGAGRRALSSRSLSPHLSPRGGGGLGGVGGARQASPGVRERTMGGARGPREGSPGAGPSGAVHGGAGRGGSLKRAGGRGRFENWVGDFGHLDAFPQFPSRRGGSPVAGKGDWRAAEGAQLPGEGRADDAGIAPREEVEGGQQEGSEGTFPSLAGASPLDRS